MILLVGQAPSPVMKPGDLPLWGTSALTRLASYAGVSPREHLYDLFEFINVIEEYPGRAPGGQYDNFPMAYARQCAFSRVWPRVWAGSFDRVVVLGRQASRAMNVDETVPYFEWLTVRETSYGREVELAVSPHPGGKVMYWNDAENRARGCEFWRGLAGEAEAEWQRLRVRT